VDKPISKHTAYRAGAARFHDLLYVSAQDRALAKQEVAHARFVGFDRGKFTHAADRAWNAAAICVVKQPKEKMVAVGEAGEVITYVGGDDTDERLTPPT
jgi:hypothetical protein